MAGKWTFSSAGALGVDLPLAPGDTTDVVCCGDGSLAAATAACDGIGVAIDFTSLPTDTGLRVVSCGAESLDGWTGLAGAWDPGDGAPELVDVCCRGGARHFGGLRNTGVFRRPPIEPGSR